jgi:plastocyanin
MECSQAAGKKTTDFMKTCVHAFVFSLAILIAHAGAVSAATLSVQVNDAAGNPVQEAAVYAEPVTSPPAAAKLKEAEIEQKGKKFMPMVTIVQTGTEVSFPNNDTVRHHVYSFSPAKQFELKLYSGKPGTPVLFDKPGTVVIGCNIHDQMVAYIQVVGTPHFGKTDQAGKVTIADLGPGKYRLKAWHRQLPAAAAPAETEITMVISDMTAALVVAIDASGSSH